MVCDDYNVNTLCEALDVSKGTYYNHVLRNKRNETKSAIRRREMLPIISEIYHSNNQIYGSGKIAAVLRERGIIISQSTVASIMHDNGMFSIRCGAKSLYLKNKVRKENILKQHFTVTAPHQVWVSDVTMFSFSDREYYL